MVFHKHIFIMLFIGTRIHVLVCPQDWMIGGIWFKVCPFVCMYISARTMILPLTFDLYKVHVPCSYFEWSLHQTLEWYQICILNYSVLYFYSTVRTTGVCFFNASSHYTVLHSIYIMNTTITFFPLYIWILVVASRSSPTVDVTIPNMSSRRYVLVCLTRWPLWLRGLCRKPS